MGHTILTSNNLGEPALCIWPKCEATTDDYPLCQRHQLKVYTRVHSDLAWVRDGVMSVEPKPETRQPSVYFVRYRDRVKIGYSIDPLTRIKAHPFDEILAIVPGDRTAEKRAHAAFAHLRENGEWFRAEDDLLEFARSIA